jgi:fatty acid desaturase
MTMSVTALSPDGAAVAPDAPAARNTALYSGDAEDKAMIRAAAELMRDLGTHSPTIYWADMLANAAIGYGTMALAMLTPHWPVALAAALVSVLTLYRAGLFIHELTHMKRSAVPGFWLGWNILVGVPMLVPSFMYEGIHSLHHARQRYGTAEDPEYLPLALMKPWTVPLFVLVAVLGPAALLLRYGVLGPLSLVIPPLRTLLVERYSGLVINPDFRRRYPEGRGKTEWIALEVACSLWAMALLAGVFTGFIPLHAFLVGFGIVSAVIVLNQLRTLVAHLWENDGAQMSITAQYLDSVNVPPPSMLPALWAPVGLRYHALHHLLPSMPYHSLGEAHRRLSAMLETQSAYHRASYPQGLPYLVRQLMLSTFRRSA